MDAAKKLAAVYLMGSALVVAAHFVFSSFYRDVVDPIAVWGVLDWFMALGIVLALAAHVHRKRALEQGPGDAPSRAYVEANLALFATAFLGLWFFWNWFDFLNLEVEAQGVVNQTVWAVIDPLFVLVAGATGRCLWRKAG